MSNDFIYGLCAFPAIGLVFVLTVAAYAWAFERAMTYFKLTIALAGYVICRKKFNEWCNERDQHRESQSKEVSP